MSKSFRNVQHIKPPQQERVCVIIPSAGDGMKSSGAKSLIRIKEKTILEHQLQSLNNSLFDYYVVLVSGYESEAVMNSMPNIIHVQNERYQDTNVMRSITLGLRACTCSQALILYGDVLFNHPMLDFPLDKSTIPLIKRDGDEVGACNKSGPITQLMYELPYKWSQMIYFNEKELTLFKQVAFNKNKEKYFVFEAINDVINMGGQIIAHTPENGRCIDIDCNKDIKIAQEQLI